MSQGRKLVLFVLGVTAAFAYICNAIPQIQAGAAAKRAAIGSSPAQLVRAGKEIFTSERAQCLTCHSLGESSARPRCPDQEKIAERASWKNRGISAAEYLVESVYDPNRYVVGGYPAGQMTPVDRPPIGLDHEGILAVLSFLYQRGGVGELDVSTVAEMRRHQEAWIAGKPRTLGRAEEDVKLPILPGDPARGYEVFRGKPECIKCHRIGDEGKDTGPDLTAIGASQTAEYLLESILSPSKIIVKGYTEVRLKFKKQSKNDLLGVVRRWEPNRELPERVVLALDTGGPGEREVTIDIDRVAAIGDSTVAEKEKDARDYGVVHVGYHVEGEAESGVTLEVLDGGSWRKETIGPDRIDRFNPPASPMPGNFAELLTPREVYDLVAYLASLKRPEE